MNLTDTQTLSLVFLGLGILVSLGTSLLKTIDLSPKVSHTIAVFLSLVASYVSSYFANNGTGDLTEVAKHSAFVYTASQLFYGYALKDSTLNAWLLKFNLLPRK